mmetsp:Transcript_8803/g.21413  ORF Transcript_8803/g.21413 Transcript_8803/m.21413 type:complete len:515 (+) Transcript_8803:82-1626(+)|eukprot:CAMPEP_0179005468 /NCGR_PEP_ID=MMETSP0795-20121207/13959_1 /TAXON_ID=88552 /ORGANISM="Amoebophrya sp., Strain Ameob2" /LENGTH=514 /DNA_ID=CAMNT_0020700009 /DNA_START=59 /DNA_END=1603 /DNA_ORIENTATION=-
MPGLAETAPGGPRTHNAQVDETLFGTKKSKSTSKDISGLMIVGKDTVQKKKGHPKQAEAAAADAGVVASIIAASDLNRIKEATKIFTKAEEMANKKINEAAKAEKEAKSRARKEKMILMEEERKMKMAMQMSDFEKEEQASTNGLLQKAKDKMDEAHDDVKHMNAMMMYSKVVTIRDAQVQEKRYIHQEREEEEAQLDTMMEIERLKALKMYEERNKARAMDQRRGAQVIIEQIKDRQSQRLREEESRDQERAFILKQIEAMKQEEVELQKAKKVAAAKLMGEVAVANAATMKIKEEKILAERLDDQQILEYQRAKERREREIEEEKKRVAAEKEAETAKLRAQQEKAANKAEEMDALRAKRAFEAAERAARAKEQQERNRVEAINEELSVARKRQTAEKEKRLAEQAKQERDEFDRIIAVQIQQEEAERDKATGEMKARYLHCDELRKQIAAREEKQLQGRRNALEEGNQVRADLAVERKKLEKIKSRKIEELKKCGVPEKYWSELAKKKIAV